MRSAFFIPFISFVSIALGVAAAFPLSHPTVSSPATFSDAGPPFVVERGTIKSADASAHTFILAAIDPYDRTPMTLTITYGERTGISKNGVTISNSESGFEHGIVNAPVRIRLKNSPGALYADQIALSPKLQPNP